jgi:hypothetical protein
MTANIDWYLQYCEDLCPDECGNVWYIPIPGNPEDMRILQGSKWVIV